MAEFAFFLSFHYLIATVQQNYHQIRELASGFIHWYTLIWSQYFNFEISSVTFQRGVLYYNFVLQLESLILIIISIDFNVLLYFRSSLSFEEDSVWSNFQTPWSLSKILFNSLLGDWDQTRSSISDLLQDNNFSHFVTDKQLEVDTVAGTKSKREGIRARSRSMVNGVRKLTRLHSFSGSVPR